MPETWDNELITQQDIVKALFNDSDTNQTLKLGAVNSINFSRILAQIVFYFYSYFSLARKSSTFKLGDKVRFVTPTGNFGNILAGYFATKMGLPVDKLVGASVSTAPPPLPCFATPLTDIKFLLYHSGNK